MSARPPMLLGSHGVESPSHAALSRPDDEQVEAEECALPEEAFAATRSTRSIPVRLSAVSSTSGECSVTRVQIFAQTIVPDR
eukprot:CAMPEP_0195087656 /NCGR_PEP_ID=MMETSP0448-20130528/27438_1 /TAXON_ID=66468 /ORGANISM="Heterocapsa triquestra, Strain CCMP 448" /LENGTH=81 /DNA_ID=CAMNT_0040121247 /DNA_START=16 /DNA_END=258 /DNA_ORIENTATION=+